MLLAWSRATSWRWWGVVDVSRPSSGVAWVEVEGIRLLGGDLPMLGPGTRSLDQDNKCALCLLALNLDTQAKAGPDTTCCRLQVLPTK